MKKKRHVGFALLVFGVVFPGAMSAVDSGISGIESVLPSWTLTVFPAIGLVCCVSGGITASDRWLKAVALVLGAIIAMACIEIIVMMVEFWTRGFHPDVF